jgi:hypothetical protein
MKIIALAIKILPVVIDALASMYPKKLLLLAREFEHLVATAIRLLPEASLRPGAARSRLPWLLRFFGRSFSSTGSTFPIIGGKGFSRMLRWLYARGPAGRALFIFAFSLLIIRALARAIKQEAEEEAAPTVESPPP